MKTRSNLQNYVSYVKIRKDLTMNYIQELCIEDEELVKMDKILNQIY